VFLIVRLVLDKKEIMASFLMSFYLKAGEQSGPLCSS